MHLSEKEIMSYFAGEASNQEKLEIENHLAECPICQVQAEQLLASGVGTKERLSVVDPLGDESAQPTREAYILFEQRYLAKEKESMFDKLFNRKYRFAWGTVGVIVLLAIAMLFPQVRAIGSSFLGLFRVEQFTIIQVDPDQIENRFENASGFESLISEDVQIEEPGEMQEVIGKAEASEKAGFTVRVPSVASEDHPLNIQPGARVSMVVDLPKVQAVIDEIGYSDLQLPAVLDGSEVSMEIPAVVVMVFGSCDVSPEKIREAGMNPDGPVPDLRECVSLAQFPSPEISAPPGLDIGGIGEVYLQVIGMSPEEAAQFSQSVDWTTTLVVPIPRYDTEHQEVFVDGVQGSLIMQSENSEFPHYLLVWIRDGIVYALSGPGSAQSAIELANSLE
jgi:hypothetical protein